MVLEKEEDNERLNILHIYVVISEKSQNDCNFPLHGDERKTKEMENFAADKPKEAEAKAY